MATSCVLRIRMRKNTDGLRDYLKVYTTEKNANETSLTEVQLQILTQ